MRVLFLLEGTTVPASRFRVLQFLPHFKAHGIKPTVVYGYGDRYNRLRRTKLGKPYMLLGRLKRSLLTPAGGLFDAVFIQRPSMPFTAAAEKALACCGGRIIFDFDDNLTVGASGQISSMRQRTFHDLIKLSDHVIAGNSFLADQARGVSDKVDHKLQVIPTVIDTDVYKPGRSRFQGECVIGWMGTSGNFPFLRQILPDVQKVLEVRPKAIFRIVSNAVLPELIDHPQVEQVPWRADDEVAHLQAFDVGLMPLEESILTQGKCGFKMIQYMSVGCLPVSSAVGANLEILGDHSFGRLVQPGGDWQSPILEILGLDESSKQAAQREARLHIEQHYSIQSVLPDYLRLLQPSL